MDWRLVAWLLLELTVASIRCDASSNRDTWWKETGRAVGRTIKDCWGTTSPHNDQHDGDVTSLLSCLHETATQCLAATMNSDVIPLTNGVTLVRYQFKNDSRTSRMSIRNEEKYGDTNVSFTQWKSLVINALSDVLDTHAIRISLHDLQTDENQEGRRRRRRRNNMFPVMMFGIIGLGMILMPMGFQFLAVLGGKALLLAKMALILTSIQGLKKVATSHINYGLYHSAPANSWYDRKAEDTYKMDDVYYNQIPEQVYEYKRYPRQ